MKKSLSVVTHNEGVSTFLVRYHRPCQLRHIVPWTTVDLPDSSKGVSSIYSTFFYRGVIVLKCSMLVGPSHRASSTAPRNASGRKHRARKRIGLRLGFKFMQFGHSIVLKPTVK